MAKFLDQSGLEYLWSKLKALLNKKSDSDHTHSAATTSAAGFMSASDKSKLNGIATGANKYSHPTYTSRSGGLYKVTVDGTGHVSDATAVTKADITDLGIPAQDTTYNAASTSAAGLMTADDKSKLDGIATGANAYTHPSYTAKASGLYKVTVDGTGHVSAATAVTKADITGLGIPAQDTTYTHPSYTAKDSGLYKVTVDSKGHVSAATAVTKADITGLGIPSTNTTYSEATTSSAGLMSAADKTKLNATNVAYGTCSTEAATAAKVISVSGNTNWVLSAGSIITVTFSATNTAENPTFNVNGTGAKSVWYGSAVITTGSLSYAGYANRPAMYMYDGTQYVFLGWSYDANTTYTNVKLGQGYATCSTAAATTAKTASLSSYVLSTGGIVAVKFTYDVPASATLNINSKGAKAIYHKGAAITAGVIKAGDTATFIYSSRYHLISLDRDTSYSEATTSTAGLMSAADKSKLDGIAAGANSYTYTHPTYTAKSSGLYKVTVDGTGHVSAATAVSKADITGLGIPAQDTTYSAASTSAAGLMSASDKSKLDAITASADAVSFSRSLSSGTKVGTITINGTGTDIYAPTNTDTTYSAATTSAAGLMSASDKSKLDGITSSADSVSFSQSLTSGTQVGTITINGTATKLYAPTNTDTTYSNATTSAAGLMSASDKSKLDGIASGANAYTHPTTSGNKHIPSGGSSGQILRWSADGTAVWGADNNTTYSAATTSTAGLMSASDKSKLDGITAGANAYTHPTYTSKTSGLYKVTVDGTGHVSGTAAVAKSDITALGIPAQDTTYSAATTSAAGLMSASDKSKLDGIATGATKVTVDSALSSSSTNPVQNKVINSALSGKSDSGHTHDPATVGGLPVVTTAGDGAAYTATISGVTALTTGLSFIMIPHTVSTTTSTTLNVNGLGAKNLRQALSANTGATTTGASNNWITSGKPVIVTYDGTLWKVTVPRPSATAIYGTVAIDKGGTGATTAADARTNLGAAPAYTYGDTDLTAGSSSLTTGTLYFYYE